MSIELAIRAASNAESEHGASTAFAPLQLTIRRSRWFGIGVTVVTLVTAIAVAVAFQSALQSAFFTATTVAVVVTVCWFLFRLQQLQPYVGELLLHHSGYAKTATLEGHLLPRSPVNALFCVLTIQPDVPAHVGWGRLLPGKRHSLIIMRDAMLPNDYRRLRLLLRWGTFSPQL